MLAGGIWRDFSPSSFTVMDGQQLSVQTGVAAAVAWQVPEAQHEAVVAGAMVAWFEVGGISTYGRMAPTMTKRMPREPMATIHFLPCFWYPFFIM